MKYMITLYMDGQPDDTDLEKSARAVLRDAEDFQWTVHRLDDDGSILETISIEG